MFWSRAMELCQTYENACHTAKWTARDLQNRWNYNKSLYFMPFLDSENDACGAKKGNKLRVLHNAIVVLLATYRYKHDTSKVER